MSSELQLALGELIKNTRAKTMDQTELALRTGLSRASISAIERGKGVNSNALFAVLSFFQLTDVIQVAVERQLELLSVTPSRKLRKKAAELSNDF